MIWNDFRHDCEHAEFTMIPHSLIQNSQNDSFRGVLYPSTREYYIVISISPHEPYYLPEA